MLGRHSQQVRSGTFALRADAILIIERSVVDNGIAEIAPFANWMNAG